MRWVAGLPVAAALAFSPGAQAAPPKQVAGVEITWPSERVFKPGGTVKVHVRSQVRRSRLALIAGGRALARRTLRSGTFRATLPAAGHHRAQLRIVVAGRAYTSTLHTSGCETSRTKASVATTTDRLHNGAPIEFEITNRGPGCMLVPASPALLGWGANGGAQLQLNCDGNVRGFDDGRTCTPPPPVELAPGERHTIVGHVPFGLRDDSYRVRIVAPPLTLTRQVQVDGLPQCPSTPGRTESRIAAASVHPGDQVPYAFVNYGPGCAFFGAGFSLEQRQPDGTFTRVELHGSVPAWGGVLEPGQATSRTAWLPADIAPGTYRLNGTTLFDVTLP